MCARLILYVGIPILINFVKNRTTANRNRIWFFYVSVSWFHILIGERTVLNNFHTFITAFIYFSVCLSIHPIASVFRLAKSYSISLFPFHFYFHFIHCLSLLLGVSISLSLFDSLEYRKRFLIRLHDKQTSPRTKKRMVKNAYSYRNGLS